MPDLIDFFRRMGLQDRINNPVNIPGDVSNETRDFYRTHPDRRPMDEKPDSYDPSQVIGEYKPPSKPNNADFHVVHSLEQPESPTFSVTGYGQKPANPLMDNFSANTGINPMSEKSVLPESVMANRAQQMDEYRPAQYKAPETPYYDRLQTQLSQPPQYEKPGKLRQILGGIVGAGTGLHTSNPFAALAANENFVDAPYRHKMQLYEQSVAPNMAAAKAEGEHIKGMSDAEHRFYQGQAEQERAGAEHARRLSENYKFSQTAHDRKLEEIRARFPEKNDKTLHEIQLKGDMGKGKNIYAFKDPKTQQITNAETGEAISYDAIEPGKISEANKPLKSSETPKNAFELWRMQNPDADIKEWLDLQGKKTQSEFDFFKEDYLKRFPHANANQVVSAFSASKETAAKPKSIIGVGPGGVVREFKSGDVMPPGFKTMQQEGQINTPTAATRGRAEQATTVIHAGEDLKQYINSHRDKLGKVGNYWQNLISGTPVGDPDIAEFQTILASYAALQAAAHGFRGSNVMHDFEQKIGGSQRNPESLVRAIDGIERTMREIEKGGVGRGSEPAQTEKKATHRFNPATGKIEVIQ